MKMERRILRLVPILLLITSCVWSGVTGSPSPAPQEASPSPSSTSSVTGTSMPVTLTSTPSATLTPTTVLTETPVPSETPTPELPGIRFPETPVPVPLPYEYPEGQMRILLLGVDSRNDAFRADAILILSVNTRQGTASLLSIPPMLYVNIPDIGMERLQSAVYFGGAGKMIDALHYNLGVRADRFLMTDFQNFLEILDSLGSIDLQVGAPLTDRCDLPQSHDGWCTIEPGLNSMDKDTAFWYARDQAGGEVERMRRTQEVLLGIFDKLMENQAPLRLDELYSTYRDHVETDLTIEDLSFLSQTSIAVFVNRQINRYSLGSQETAPATLPGNENVLLLDQNAAWKLIFKAVFQP